MSNKNTFISIAELAATEVSISRLATAIEMVGFNAWDRFGRFTHVKPIDADNEQGRLRNSVLDALAKGYKGDEVDIEYFENMRFGPSVLSLSGWTESTVPNFDQLHNEWSQQHTDQLSVPTTPVPLPVFKEPKRKDDWYLCIQHAITDFQNVHGCFPSEPQTWMHLRSGKPMGWGLQNKDDTLILDESVLDRENFRKRFYRYFQYSAEND
jgi:hypothetical protein